MVNIVTMSSSYLPCTLQLYISVLAPTSLPNINELFHDHWPWRDMFQIWASMPLVDKYNAPLSQKALHESVGGDFDFITLTEIGPSNLDSRRAALIWDIVHEFTFDKPNSIKGGACLIYNKNINLIERRDLKLTSENIGTVENIWLQTQDRDNYIIGILYRHPGSNIDCLDEFTKQLETVLLKINDENIKWIITGDLNIDGLNINMNDHVKPFFNTALQNAFIPTITSPTHIVDSSVSLIDHIWINSQFIKKIVTL